MHFSSLFIHTPMRLNHTCILHHHQVISFHSRWKKPCVMQYARADLPERLKRLPLEPTDVVASAPALAPEFSLQEHDHHHVLIMSCPYHTGIMSLSCPYHIMSLS